VEPWLSGQNTSRVSGRTIELIIADADDDDVGFKIINWKKFFRNGQPVPNPVSNDELREYFSDVNLFTGHVKQGIAVPGSIHSRNRFISIILGRHLEDGTKINVENDDSEERLRSKRMLATVLAFAKEIETNGEGNTL